MPLKRVLIVDDALDLGRLLQAALVTLDAGLQISVIPSGEEALLEVGRQPVDLLITDVRLPGMSGLLLTKRMRARKKDLKVIQISGLSDSDLERQSLEAGADYFLHKPLDMPNFLRLVDQLLGLNKTLSPEGEGAVIQARTAHRVQPLLNTLIQAAGAQCVCIFDRQGQMYHQAATDQVTETSREMLAALALTLAEGKKVLAGSGKLAWQGLVAWRGSEFDLVACPIDETFSVMAVVPKTRHAARMLISAAELLAWQDELRSALADSGEPAQPARTAGSEIEAAAKAAPEPPSTRPLDARPPAPEQPVPALPADGVPQDDKLAAQLDALLGSQQQAPVKHEQADSFWEQAASDEKAARFKRPDSFTFDEAQRMGLAPEEDHPAG